MIKRDYRRIALYLLIVGLLIISLAPFLWQALTSLRPDHEIALRPTRYLPRSTTFAHYLSLFTRKPFTRYFINSFIVSSLATLGCLTIGSLAAYAFARLDVPARRLLLWAILSISIFPPIIFLFPIYEMMRAAQLTNNLIALAIPYMALNLPFTIWVLTSFFRQIPHELEDAALLDGFTRLQILSRIVLPLAAPALVTTGILVFIFCWNEFVFALTFTTEDTYKTLTAGTASLSGSSNYEIPWGPLSAATVLATLPLVVLVFLFQRRIVEGLTAGSVKG
ncbi:MAG: carbohydrate ABC transporter permease [Acidobacteriota bacterium]